MPSSLKLFTIRGIPVDINATWLIAFALITWTFSTSWFPVLSDLESTIQYWIAGVIATLMLFASVLAHELGHSFVALSQGLKVRGITLLLFGGVSRIEGNASRPRNEFFIAFAGPAVSLVIGIVLLIWIFTVQPDGEPSVMRLVIFATGWMNVLLSIFNLLPGYPMDGGRVLRAAVWGFTGDSLLASRIAYTVGRGVFYLMIAWGAWRVLNGDVTGGIWIVLIGWFLMSGARNERAAQDASEKRERARDELAFMVGAAVRTMPTMIEEGMTVFQVQSEGHLADSPESIPVSRRGELVGFVTPQEFDTVPAERRSEVVVGQIMNPGSLRIVTAQESVRDALRSMDRHNVTQLVVMDGAYVIGIVSRRDILAMMLERRMATENAETFDSDSSG